MNTNLLRASLAAKGMTQRDLAKAIGVSENSMSRKVTGKREFSISEAAAICEVLNLERPDAIFFMNVVPNTQRTKVQKTSAVQDRGRNA